MRFALMTEPQQGYSYQDILDTALTAERPASRRSSAPTTTSASRATGPAAPRTPGRRWRAWPVRRPASAWAPWSRR